MVPLPSLSEPVQTALALLAINILLWGFPIDPCPGGLPRQDIRPRHYTLKTAGDHGVAQPFNSMLKHGADRAGPAEIEQLRLRQLNSQGVSTSTWREREECINL